MIVIIDNTPDETVLEAKNYAIIVLPLEGGRERHIKVTHEGIIEEIVEDGVVLRDTFVLHDDFLDEP